MNSDWNALEVIFAFVVIPLAVFVIIISLVVYGAGRSREQIHRGFVRRGWWGVGMLGFIGVVWLIRLLFSR